MAIQPELTCNACKKRSPLNTMKYSKDGSGLICEDCLMKQNGGVNLRNKPQATFDAKPAVQTEQKKKVMYTCKTCNFRFSRALDFRGPRLCPNCGRGDVIYNLPNKADDLLRELDEMDDI